MDTPKPKPDMLAASSRHGGGKRILAALEHGARPAAKPMRNNGWTIDGWTLSLCLLLLLMLSVAWLMHDKKIDPSGFKHSDGGDRRTASPSRMDSPAMPTIEQAASIVNESPTLARAASPGGVGETDQPNQPPLASVPFPETESTLAPSVQQPRKPALAGANTAMRASQTATTQNPAPAARSQASAGNAAGGGAAGGAGTGGGRGAGTGAAVATRDTDVTLLAALVAHANKPTVILPERSRDVVERKEGDTTAELLARCQQLGLIEGMLCRSRICSDRWDADAACRAPAR